MQNETTVSQVAISETSSGYSSESPNALTVVSKEPQSQDTQSLGQQFLSLGQQSLEICQDVQSLETWRAEPTPPDQHPALVYLARLAPGSRRTMGEALTIAAMLLSQNQCDLWTLAWQKLRYQHTAALRSRLAQQYAPATVNKMLAALRGTLKECWRLGLIPAEDYHRAADLPAVRGSVLPRGRASRPENCVPCSLPALRTSLPQDGGTVHWRQRFTASACAARKRWH